MMKQNGQRFLAAMMMVALLGMGSKSFASFKLSALLGMSAGYQTATNTPYSFSSSSKVAFSGGFLGTYKFPDVALGITSGLLFVQNYTHQTSSNPVNSFDITFNIPYFQIPIELNYWFMNMFALGGGLYYAFPGGNVDQEGTEFVQGVGYFPISKNTSFSDANVTQDDYGLLLHAQVLYNLPGGYFLNGSAMYEFGLENVTQVVNNNVHNYNFLLQVGAGITFQ